MESDCQLDYISIVNGGLASSPPKGSYCGSKPLTTFTSESNEMRVLFVTDNVGSAAGFRMQYSFDSRGQCSPHPNVTLYASSSMQDVVDTSTAPLQ